ncbi:MAG: MOFRL family protein [Halofilum sp. (in: g-proteobacteria)]|nr:MOFRL family protein [Halofilum sp. (in: g-proteobacteria)]
MLCEPAPGLTLAQKQEVTRALLASGASIHEINAVRQRLSAIKGGRLALAAAPAPVCTLLVSDIPGDEPALVASGPTIGSPFGPDEAGAVVARHGLELPAAARERLADNVPPTPAELGARCHHTVLCSAMQSLEAAAAAARAAGLAPLLLGDGLEGEARAMGTVHGGIAHSVRRWHQPVAPPAVLLSGGEATVTLGDAGGRGGRNTEFLLALAIALDGAAGIHALAADTDGIDGSEDNAGAVIGPDTLARARALGIDPHDALARHDAYGFFEALGDLVDTGPTGTNVNDFRALVIE